MPLAAACTVSLCSFRRLTLYLYVSFFLFSANFPFCGPVAVLSPPSLPMDEWLSSPSRAYYGTTTNRDNNGTIAMMCGDNVGPRGHDDDDRSCGTIRILLPTCTTAITLIV